MYRHNSNYNNKQFVGRLNTVFSLQFICYFLHKNMYIYNVNESFAWWECRTWHQSYIVTRTSAAEKKPHCQCQMFTLWLCCAMSNQQMAQSVDKLHFISLGHNCNFSSSISCYVQLIILFRYAWVSTVEKSIQTVCNKLTWYSETQC